MQVRDFTLRQLAAFVQAARAGSFAKAAEQLGISQPAISDHIAALEQRIGHPLFQRRRGAPSLLTEAGEDLLEKAETLLNASESMRAPRDHSVTAERIPIRLCIGPHLRDTYLKPVLPRLYRELPDVELITIPMMPLPDVRAAMDRREVDLLLCTVGTPPDWPGIRLLSTVPAELVGTPEIARQVEDGTIELDDLQFIIPGTGRFGERWLERQLPKVGISPRLPIRYVEYPDVIQAMVEEGRGVTVLMHEQVKDAIEAGRLVVFGPEFPPMQRILVRSERAPEQAQAVERVLIEALKPATGKKDEGRG